MSGVVHIASTWRSNLVYHDLVDVIVDQSREGNYLRVFRCGLKMDDTAWCSAVLPERHAALFARPCRRCFDVTADARIAEEVAGPDDDDYLDRPALARTHPYGNGAI